jgi:hypothetical protein
MTELRVLRSPLTLVETFELTAPLAEFNNAVAAFCRRVEKDGLTGVRTFQFYVSQEVGEAYLIITFSDADVFDRHVEFIGGLDELEPYVNTVRLKHFKAFGTLNAEILEKLRAADFQFEWVNEYVTGFVRNTERY